MMIPDVSTQHYMLVRTAMPSTGALPVNRTRHLGPRDDVLNALSVACPDIAWQSLTRIMVGTTASGVKLVVADRDPLRSVLCEASGDNVVAVLGLLQRVRRETGWRVLDLRSGKFVNPEDVDVA